MTRRFLTLVWSAAACTYLLIVLGAVVRITGSGLGCGEHWPLCNGHLFPPLNDIGTLIEWSHRLVAGLVTILVVVVAAYARFPGLARVAVALLVIQILLGAITVKLALPPWTVVLHLGTAMLLLATLLMLASPPVPVSTWRAGSLLIVLLAFVTVLFGALTANLGAASACGGFPLCNGQVWTTAGPLAVIHWTHRLLAFSLTIAAIIWAARSRRTGPTVVVLLIVLQILLGAAMVLNGLPRVLQAAHVAVGAAVWAGVVLASLSSTSQRSAAPETLSPRPQPDSSEKPVSSAS